MDCRASAGADEPLAPFVEREINAVRMPSNHLLHRLGPAVRNVLGGRVRVDVQALARLGRPGPL
eukprot:3687807-Alexandrium_andersonii.AAC.1